MLDCKPIMGDFWKEGKKDLSTTYPMKRRKRVELFRYVSQLDKLKQGLTSYTVSLYGKLFSHFLLSMQLALQSLFLAIQQFVLRYISHSSAHFVSL